MLITCFCLYFVSFVILLTIVIYMILYLISHGCVLTICCMLIYDLDYIMS